MEVPPGS